MNDSYTIDGVTFIKDPRGNYYTEVGVYVCRLHYGDDQRWRIGQMGTIDENTAEAVTAAIKAAAQLVVLLNGENA